LRADHPARLVLQRDTKVGEVSFNNGRKSTGGVVPSAKGATVEPIALKLEVVVLGVSNIDRAEAFYEPSNNRPVRDL
jgi:hypothetical protein